jgi:hypothetical protein
MWLTSRAPFDSSQRCVIYVSRDAGSTWEATAEIVSRCGDPWVAIGPEGAAYFTALGQAGMVLHRSLDGGTRWLTTAMSLGRSYDHPSMTVGPAAAGATAPVYVYANQGFMRSGRHRQRLSLARSEDQGATAVRLPPLIPSNLNLNSLAVATTSTGMLVLPFFDFNRPPVPNEEEPPRLERARAWLVTSPDRGVTLSEPMLITEMCLPHQGGFPTLAVDRSDGQWRDRLYFACRIAGGLAVFHSADGGEGWSEPVLVASDSGMESRSVRPAVGMAVSQAGVVGLIWQDRRGDPARRCQHAYFAASADGGTRFSPPVRVSSTPSCPGAMPDSAIAVRFAGGGDYGTIAATADSLFHPVWADGRSGRFQLWTAAIRVR